MPRKKMTAAEHGRRKGAKKQIKQDQYETARADMKKMMAKDMPDFEWDGETNDAFYVRVLSEKGFSPEEIAEELEIGLSEVKQLIPTPTPAAAQMLADPRMAQMSRNEEVMRMAKTDPMAAGLLSAGQARGQRFSGFQAGPPQQQNPLALIQNLFQPR